MQRNGSGAEERAACSMQAVLQTLWILPQVLRNENQLLYWPAVHLLPERQVHLRQENAQATPKDE